MTNTDTTNPTPSGVRPEQLFAGWLAAAQITDRSFQTIAPIRSVALIGVTLDPVTNRLSLRDEIVSRAIMREVLPHVSLAPDARIDVYGDLYGDASAVKTPCDLAIFCDVPGNEHPDFARQIGARFIAAWGVTSPRIRAEDFTQPVKYDLRASPGQRLLQRFDFTQTQAEYSEYDLMQPYMPAALQCLPLLPGVGQAMPRLPEIEFAVRNDVLDQMAGEKDAAQKAGPLLADGIETVHKMDLLAQINQRRGRAPIGSHWHALGQSTTMLQHLLTRPLTTFERLELGLRRGFG